LLQVSRHFEIIFGRGLGIIFDMDSDGLRVSHTAGVELGYFFQFGIFSYIMTAIINTSVRKPLILTPPCRLKKQSKNS